MNQTSKSGIPRKHPHQPERQLGQEPAHCPRILLMRYQ